MTWLKRVATRLQQPLNLLAPPVRSQILVIVQADSNVAVAYDHPRCAEDVKLLIQGLGTALQIVATRHQVPLAVQQADGSMVPLTNVSPS